MGPDNDEAHRKEPRRLGDPNDWENIEDNCLTNKHQERDDVPQRAIGKGHDVGTQTDPKDIETTSSIESSLDSLTNKHQSRDDVPQRATGRGHEVGTQTDPKDIETTSSIESSLDSVQPLPTDQWGSTIADDHAANSQGQAAGCVHDNRPEDDNELDAHWRAGAIWGLVEAFAGLALFAILRDVRSSMQQ